MRTRRVGASSPRPARSPVRVFSRPVVRVAVLLTAVLSTAALAACGGGSSKPLATGGSGPPSAGAPGRATGTADTSNGSYQVTLTVGAREAGAVASPCAPAVVPGSTSLPVVVTVANGGTQPVPFPPLRVELIAGGAPVPVPVQGSSGTCSFIPRAAAIEAGGSVSFSGSTPPIADSASPGSAGTVQVAMSENDFSISVPVP